MHLQAASCLTPEPGVLGLPLKGLGVLLGRFRVVLIEGASFSLLFDDHWVVVYMFIGGSGPQSRRFGGEGSQALGRSPIRGGPFAGDPGSAALPAGLHLGWRGALWVGEGLAARRLRQV